MAKYCGKCGSLLDPVTGLCPKCAASFMEVPPTPPADPAHIHKKARQSERRTKRKAAKRKLQKQLPLGRKIRRWVIKLVTALAVLGIAFVVFSGILVYFDMAEIPPVAAVLEKSGIKETEPAKSDLIQFGQNFTDISVTDPDSAVKAVQEAAAKLGLETAEELSVISSDTVDGVTYYRLQQNYAGIPVYGRTFVVSADAQGTVQGMSTNCVELGAIDTSMVLSSDQVKDAVRKYLAKSTGVSANEISVINNFSRTIYTFSEKQGPVLAYHVYAMAGEDLYSVFLGIEPQTVLACFLASETETVSASGKDKNGYEVSFDAEKLSEDSYTLEDTQRNLQVYDAGGKNPNKITMLVLDSRGNRYDIDGSNFVDPHGNIVQIDDNGLSQRNWKILDSDGNILDTNAYMLPEIHVKNKKLELVQSDTPQFSNAAAVSLMSKAQYIYDFFCTELGRTGFDGKNGSMALVANTKTLTQSLDTSLTLPAAVLYFSQKDELSTEQIAHEYMHSVERSISGMVYDGESGAIMEAYSDVFGEILEDFEDGVLGGSCDWIHHAAQNWFGTLLYDETRNMKAPHQSNHPSYVGDTTNSLLGWVTVSKNEVHHASTIVSHAAYLMTTAQSGEQPLTMEELMTLWYRTLLTLPSNCTFSDLRNSMILTAENMGFSAEKVGRVISAFEEVGIGDQAYCGSYQTNLDITVFDFACAPYSQYSVEVEGAQTSFFGHTKPYSARYISNGDTVSISLKPGTYSITVTDTADSKNSYTKSIVIDSDAVSKNLRFTTDFGQTAVDAGNTESSLPDTENSAPENVPQEAAEFNGHFYRVYNIDGGITWQEAKEYCERQGGHLATITSPEEQSFISDLIRDEKKRSYWIGLTDEDESGNWQWVNGEPFIYSNWAQHEPNNGYGGMEHYAAVVSYDTQYDYPIHLGEWNDHANDRDIEQFGFLCEWEETDISLTPPPEDLDETSGVTENVPQDAYEFNGHFYYVYDIDTITTWEAAKQYCRDQGGYLATITSPEENAFIYSCLKDLTYESAYFGLTDQTEEGTWVWDNGEVSSYTNWHSGEPNSENPAEDFAMFYYKYSDGSWNDGDFGNHTLNSGRSFICEWGN